MNKKELIGKMAEKSGLSRRNAELALDAFISSVGDSLKKGEKVQLIGFGSFETVKTAKREGRNPSTGKAITIPAGKKPKFTAGKGLKELVNGKKK